MFPQVLPTGSNYTIGSTNVQRIFLLRNSIVGSTYLQPCTVKYPEFQVKIRYVDVFGLSQIFGSILCTFDTANSVSLTPK